VNEIAPEPPTPPTGQITVTPTKEFFNATDILVRAWEGTTEAGEPVVAFIAAVTAPDGSMPSLAPVPSPEDRWDEHSRGALGHLWKLVEKMEPVDIGAITTLVDHWMALNAHTRLTLLRDALLVAAARRGDR
jgi:hypothetical protein